MLELNLNFRLKISDIESHSHGNKISMFPVIFSNKPWKSNVCVLSWLFLICICHKFTTLQNPKQVKYTKKMSDICFLLHLQLDQILISVCFPFILGIPFWDFKILRDDWSCHRLKNLGDLWNLSSTCSVCVCVCARGDLSAWTPWNFYHWFYFILLPILSPFWQHVLSPPLVKSSKRIKHFIPQHTRLSIRV